MSLQQFVDQFIKKYLGKQVEYHSYNPNAKFQCVDLANQYIKELGLTPVIGTNAKDFPSKISTKEFKILKNTPDFKPIVGDISIWNGRVGGGAGHIAIVRDNNATLSKFNSVDQNWNKPLYVTLETHTYSNVTHFLRPIQTGAGNPPSMPEKPKYDEAWIEEQLMHLKNEREKNERLAQQVSQQKTEIANLNTQLDIEKELTTKLQARVDQLEKQPATGIVRIDKEVPVAGLVWEINGIQIDSDGKITANYAKK